MKAYKEVVQINQIWFWLKFILFQTADGVLKSSGDAGDRLSGVREWDRNKMGEERDGDKRQDRERRQERDREVKKSVITMFI